MRKVREILRLRFERGLSQRQISASTGVSKGAIGEYMRRAAAAGVTWDVARALDDSEVETRLFRYPGRNEPPRRVPIDLPWVHRELRRTGMTLQQLWIEYRDGAAAGLPSGGTPYGYSQFCDLYADFRQRADLSMRQVHRAGEKIFIDYSGKKPRIWSAETGEAIEVELFVAVLGASNYTFAEATRTQRLEDFCASTVRALEFFGGVPKVAVPDQLRSAVSGPDRYDPEINPTYAELAQHYDLAIVPARPGKPRDKAKVVLVSRQQYIDVFFAGDYHLVPESLADISQYLGFSVGVSWDDAWVLLSAKVSGAIGATSTSTSRLGQGSLTAGFAPHFGNDDSIVPYVGATASAWRITGGTSGGDIALGGGLRYHFDGGNLGGVLVIDLAYPIIGWGPATATVGLGFGPRR